MDAIRLIDFGLYVGISFAGCIALIVFAEWLKGRK